MRDKVIYTMNGTNGAVKDLHGFLKELISDYPNAYQFAEKRGVSYGLVYYVLGEPGRDSDTLRRQLGIRKTNRRRLCIDCDEELVQRFYKARGELPSWEFLTILLDWYDNEWAKDLNNDNDTRD